MAYEIRYTDEVNKGVIVVEDNDLDNSSTSIAFPGKDLRGYGLPIAENFLHLLENFANDTAPPSPVEGQLWYDTSNGVDQLKVYDGTNWSASGGLKKASSEPAVTNSIAGELWVNTETQQLYLFTGTSWILVGPNFSDGLLTGTESQQIIGIDNITYTVLAIKIEDLPAVIVSSQEFTPKTVIAGFRTGIKPGLNLSTAVLVGSSSLKYWGISEKSESLVIAGKTVPASVFLRGDATSTTNFDIRIKNNEGVKVGAAGQLSIGIENEAGTGIIQHNTSNSAIDFRLRNGTVTPTILRIDANGFVGINNFAPEVALDVKGNVIISPKTGVNDSGELRVDSVQESDSISRAAIVTSGGASIAKSLRVGDNLFVSGTMTTADIVPDLSTSRNIGTSSNRYDQVYAQTFLGNLQGNVSGTVSGRAGSANRLASATTFSVSGDVENTSFSFDGATGGTNKTFDIRIANSFISNKESIAEVDNADQILINKVVGETGVFNVTKRNFLKSIPLMPPGVMLPYGGEEAPEGWLFCDGSEVNIADFTELFKIINYNFRDKTLLTGNGVSVFALPDMRGRFPLGLDNINGPSANRVTDPAADVLGGNNGTETTIINTENLPDHEHNMEGESGTQYYGFRVGSGQPTDDNAIALSTEPGTGGTQGLASSGGVRTAESLGARLSLMNPFLGTNYIIYTGN